MSNKNKEEELKEIEETLKEGKLIDNDESVIKVEKGDYWEKFLIFNSQVRGYYYFTQKRIIFFGGLAGSTQWNVKYKDIVDLKKCNVGLFIPTGIKLTYFNEKKNKNKSYKLSLLKRENWINFIKENI